MTSQPTTRKPQRKTQACRIAETLLIADGGWVESWHLQRDLFIMGVNARVWDLRKRWELPIQCKTIDFDGTRRGYFRVAPTAHARWVVAELQAGHQPPKPATKKSPAVEPLTPAATLPFGGAR